MPKKSFVIFGFSLIAFFIFLITPSYYYLPEKFFVDNAKKQAFIELQKFAKEESLNVQDFKLTDIKRGCCADGYDYHILYCHPKYIFGYDSFLIGGGGRPLKKGEACQLDPNMASQYSPYLKKY